MTNWDSTTKKLTEPGLTLGRVASAVLDVISHIRSHPHPAATDGEEKGGEADLFAPARCYDCGLPLVRMATPVPGVAFYASCKGRAKPPPAPAVEGEPSDAELERIGGMAFHAGEGAKSERRTLFNRGRSSALRDLEAKERRIGELLNDDPQSGSLKSRHDRYLTERNHYRAEKMALESKLDEAERTPGPQACRVAFKSWDGPTRSRFVMDLLAEQEHFATDAAGRGEKA